MYIIFFIFIFFFFYNFAILFWPVFQLLSIPSGFYSIPTLCIAALCSTQFFFQTAKKKLLLRELLFIVIAWAPWLIYLAYRCDFDDPYSYKKFILMSIGQFGTILMICCAFYKDKEKFVKYFYICTIAMISIVLVYFFFNHSVYSIQGVKIKGRLGTEGVNPIEMSRMFAIGALSLMLWGRFSYWIKVVLCIPFFIGMILTGSRGPVISVSIVLACHYLWTQSQHRLIAIRLFLSCVLLIIALWTVGAYFQDPIDKYFTRGHRQGMYQGSGRYSAALVTWKEFVSEPFWGVGLGKYGKPGTQASPTIDLSNKPINRDYPHNILYEVAAELGIVGIILFIFLLRPGAWVFDFSNKFIYLFFLCFLFAMTSGDFFDNAGVFTFAYIARLNRKPKVE